jgi:hypothetical protein
MMGRATKRKCPNVIEHLSATAPSQVFGKLSDRAAAAQQIDDHHNQGNDQQYVNQTTGYVQAKAQDPQNQKHSNNRPKHVSLLSSTFSFNLLRSALWCILPPSGNTSERLSALQAQSFGSRRDQPAERAHPL